MASPNPRTSRNIQLPNESTFHTLTIKNVEIGAAEFTIGINGEVVHQDTKTGGE